MISYLSNLRVTLYSFFYFDLFAIFGTVNPILFVSSVVLALKQLLLHGSLSTFQAAFSQADAYNIPSSSTFSFKVTAFLDLSFSYFSPCLDSTICAHGFHYRLCSYSDLVYTLAQLSPFSVLRWMFLNYLRLPMAHTEILPASNTN